MTNETDTSNQALPTEVESNETTTGTNTAPTDITTPTSPPTLTVVNGGLDIPKEAGNASISGSSLDESYDASQDDEQDETANKALTVGLLAGITAIVGFVAYKLLF